MAPLAPERNEKLARELKDLAKKPDVDDILITLYLGDTQKFRELKTQGDHPKIVKAKQALYIRLLEVIEAVDFKVKPHIENAAIFNMMVDEKLDEQRKALAELFGEKDA